MSDDMPAWAQAMEQRLAQRIDGLGKAIDARFEAFAADVEARAEIREHHLLNEITKAIADAEARLTRRIDDLRDDIGVTMARADLAHTKIDSDRLEIATMRKELASLYRRLQNIEDRLFKGGADASEAG